jgi:four helix bundle protein
MLQKERDIYKRIDRFVLQSLFLVKKIPLDLVNKEILKQAIRSISSIGANAREAEAAQTKKEFIRCFSISKREAKESQYWLYLLTNFNSEFATEFEVLIKECDELIAIISAIISSSKKNMEK